MARRERAVYYGHRFNSCPACTPVTVLFFFADVQALAMALLAQQLLAMQSQAGSTAPQSDGAPPLAESEAKQLPPGLLAYVLTCMSHERKPVRKQALQALSALTSALARLPDLLPEDSIIALQDLASVLLEQVSPLLLDASTCGRGLAPFFCRHSISDRDPVVPRRQPAAVQGCVLPPRACVL